MKAMGFQRLQPVFKTYSDSLTGGVPPNLVMELIPLSPYQSLGCLRGVRAIRICYPVVKVRITDIDRHGVIVGAFPKNINSSR